LTNTTWPRGAHPRQQQPGQLGGRGEVHGQLALPRRYRQIAHAAEFDDARGVDDAVDPVRDAVGILHRVGDRAGCARSATTVTLPGNACARSSATGGIAHDEHEAVAARREALGDQVSDAGARPVITWVAIDHPRTAVVQTALSSMPHGEP
jgi:hypothetical protein